MITVDEAVNFMREAEGEIHRLRALNAEMWAALCKIVCPECSHELQHHADRYGCEVERGDGYRSRSEIEEALGPCGCSVGDLRDDYPFLVRAIEVIQRWKGNL